MTGGNVVGIAGALVFVGALCAGALSTSTARHPGQHRALAVVGAAAVLAAALCVVGWAAFGGTT